MCVGLIFIIITLFSTLPQVFPSVAVGMLSGPAELFSTEKKSRTSTKKGDVFTPS